MIDPLEPESEPLPVGSAPSGLSPLPERRLPMSPGAHMPPQSGPVIIPLAQPGGASAPQGGESRADALPGGIGASERCPSCSAALPAGTATCPICGERLREKQPVIRCRRCGARAPAVLTLCPHCGRELIAAPSRWLTIGAPAALALSLLAVLALQSEGTNPFRWVTDGLRSTTAWVGNLSAQLDPQVVVLPAAESAELRTAGEDNGAAVAASDLAGASLPMSETLTITAALFVTSVESLPVAAQPEVAVAPASLPEASAPTATALPLLALVPTATPTTTPLPEPTATPTVAPTAASTLPPTVPPTVPPTTAPTVAPTTAPVEYEVQQGDTALGIATRFGVDLQTLLAANSLTPAQATLLQPGQRLRIPLASAAEAAAGSVYSVRAGDTLAGISVLVGIPMETLMQVNNLTAASATRLQPGQTLILPAPTSTPGPTATPTLAATATPLPTATAAPTATPLAAATAASLPTPTLAPTGAPGGSGALGMRLSAPVLRGPVDGVTIRCTTAGRLLWEPAPGMLATDQYRVHLGFIGGRDEAGNPRSTWLIQQDIPGSVTQVNLDPVLCAQAPAEFGNQWRWYVEVVAPSGAEGSALVPVSPPSDVWGFVWN